MSPVTHEAPKARLDSLTGLRFIAAMQIVFHHYIIMIPGFRAAAPEWVKRLVASGPTAIVIFFALSGFVLAYNYLQPDGSLAVTRKKFWGARVARIYPMYLAAFIIYAPIAIARYYSGTGLSVVDVGPAPAFWISGILSLLLMQSWSIVFLAWNEPTWSVSAEAFFYAIYPWVARWMARLGPRRIFAALMGFWIIFLAFPIYFLAVILGHSGKQTKELWEVTLNFQPLLRVVPFLFGMAAGMLFLRRREDGIAAHPALLTITVLVILIACLSVPTEAELLLVYGLTPLYTVLIYLLAFERNILSKVLANRYIVLLGEASFSIYLLHNPLWNYLARIENIYSMVFRHHFPVGLSKPGVTTEWNYDMSGWMFCLYLAVLFSLSLLCWRYIEKPGRAYIRRLFQEDERPQAAALATGQAVLEGIS